MAAQHDEKRLIVARWEHQNPEREGNYWFNGQIFTTNQVQADIPEIELVAIITYLQTLAFERKGIDYLQVFVNEDGDKIFVIDQLTKQQVETSPKEYHYCTFLYPHEY